jgi:hypothetical protein
MSGHDEPNTQGAPDENTEADTASGGAPEEPDTSRRDDDSASADANTDD